MSSLAKRLRKARKKAGLSQPELAERSGVSQQAISRIERGEQKGTSFLVALADACGVDPAWLYSESQRNAALTIATRIQKLREEQALSQTDLALILDISPQAVQAWEADKTQPKLINIQMLAHHFGVDPGWLAFGTPTEQAPKNDELTVIIIKGGEVTVTKGQEGL